MILYLLFRVQNCLVTLIFALKLSSRQFPDKFGQHLLTQRWFFFVAVVVHLVPSFICTEMTVLIEQFGIFSRNDSFTRTHV